MSFLKWFKNVFDFSAESPSRFTRPPERDPGWYNRQRGKQANNACSRRVPRRGAKVVKSKSKASVGRARGSRKPLGDECY